ncbi:MAG: energy transducer TonB [Acidobacteriota bacterium]
MVTVRRPIRDLPVSNIRERYLYTLLLLLMTPLMQKAAAQELLDIDSAEKRLKSQFLGKTVFVRNFYEGNSLRFSSEGTLFNNSQSGPWTLYAQIELTEIKLNTDTLELSGTRLFVYFDKKTKQFKGAPLTEAVQISVETVPGTDITKLEQALSKIFLFERAKLADLVPPYWKKWLLNETAADGDSQALGRGVRGAVYRLDDVASRPRLLTRSEPMYPEIARRASVEGKLIVSAVVSKAGQLQVMDIIEPLGLGLDEAAIESMRRWKFAPARHNGEPVDVELNIEVNFALINSPR